jgi:tripartite-type tricarboxylate transporter receptor subunit TctC
VDNRAGGGGIIAAELVARHPRMATPYSSPTRRSRLPLFLQQKLPYDSVKDFAPITEIANQPLLLIAHPSVPANTSRTDRACQGETEQPHGGYSQVGSATHLATETFKFRTDTVKSLVSVSYKGGAAAQVALLSGEIQIAFATTTPRIPQLKTGKVKAIATRRRSACPICRRPDPRRSRPSGFEAGAWQG